MCSWMMMKERNGGIHLNFLSYLANTVFHRSMKKKLLANSPGVYFVCNYQETSMKEVIKFINDLFITGNNHLCVTKTWLPVN